MNPLPFVGALLPRVSWWWLVLAGGAAIFAGHLADVRAHERRSFAAGQAAVQSRWDAAELARAEVARRAEGDARLEEQRRTAAMKENADETQRLAARDRAAAAGADAASVGLRRAVAAAVTGGRGAAGDSGAAAVSPPGTQAGVLLADVLGPAEERLRALAAGLDESRRAGESCERAYDALTSAVSQ